MINMKNNQFKMVTASVLAISAFAGLLAPATASAAQVGGTATITIDNTAFAASNAYGNWVNKFWGAADNNLGITGSTAGGTTLSPTGITELLLPVNTNFTTTACPACGPYGRTLQATTMDTSDTSTGQIGLSGALLVDNATHSGTVTPYDFSLVKTAGTWNIRTFDTAFGYQNFLTLTGVTESLDLSGQLMLSGDLRWTGLWKSLAGANGSVVGTFSLAPAAVPIPGAAWLFGGALSALAAAARRKSVLPA